MTTSSSATSAGNNVIVSASFEAGSNPPGGHVRAAEVQITAACAAEGGTLDGRRTFNFKKEGGTQYIEFKQNCRVP